MQQLRLEEHSNQMVALSHQLEGYQTITETRFLSVLPFVQGRGEILEIGSFKGKSTIILAKSAIQASSPPPLIHACDPHLLPFISQDDLTGQLRANLQKNSVSENVKFYQMKSTELAKSWNLPLKILWIDGDHTYKGTQEDFEAYKRFLVPGGIVCFHDVLHNDDGPTRIFMQEIVLSKEFGDFGICGSIAWGQYLGASGGAIKNWDYRLDLYRKLSKLVPYVSSLANGIPVSKIQKLMFKLRRHFVPHGEIDLTAWVTERNNIIAGMAE